MRALVSELLRERALRFTDSDDFLTREFCERERTQRRTHRDNARTDFSANRAAAERWTHSWTHRADAFFRAVPCINYSSIVALYVRARARARRAELSLYLVRTLI